MIASAEVVTFAVRNLARHRARTLFTLSTICAGVVALILAGGFIVDSVVELGDSIIRSQSGHIQIQFTPIGAGKGLSDTKGIESPEALKRELEEFALVREAMFRSSFDGLLGNGKIDWAITIEGIEPGPEGRLGTYVEVLSGRQLNETDDFSIVLGAGVASALNVTVGDWVSVTTTTTDGALNFLELQVVGVFRSFSKDYDARAARTPLATAQLLRDSQSVNMAVLHLENTAFTDQTMRVLKQSLKPGYRARDWKQLSPFYRQTVQLYTQQFGFLLIVILLAVILSVSTAIAMTVHERIPEFGTMRAIGFNERVVRELILVEGALLGAFGATVGLLAGNGLALLISAVGIPMPPPPNSDIAYVALVRVNIWVSLAALAVGFAAPLLAAWHASKRASRLDIAEALRRAV